MKKDLKFEILRILSMIVIVLYHYTTRFNELVGHHDEIIFHVPTWLGTVAVSIFLLMVGFFSYSSIENSKLSPFKFLKKRFLRLYPIFLETLIITTLVVIIFKFQKITFIQFLTNALLINRLFGIESIDGAYWYLIIIIVFTFLCFFHKLFKSRFKFNIFSLYCLFYCLIAIIQFKFNIVPDIVIYLGFRYINKCLIGYYIFSLFRNIAINDRIKNIVFIFILLLGEFSFSSYMRYMSDFAAIFIFFLVCFIPKCTFTNTKIYNIVTYISDKTYYMFLIHEMVGFSLINYFENRGFAANNSIILVLFIVCLFIFIRFFLVDFLNSKLRKEELIV